MAGPSDNAPQDSGSPSGSSATLSQWQLIRLHFQKHRIAVFSLSLIGTLYLTAIFAPFIAPFGKSYRDTDYINCPPQYLKFSFDRGLHVSLITRELHPITRESYYLKHEDAYVPVKVLPKGERYDFLGLIPIQRHLIGPDMEEWNRLFSEYDLETPPFFILGADRYGHDLWSRIIHGSRISLSIGIIAIVITSLLGIIIGGISGYFGGAADLIIQRIIEIMMAFPTLPLWLALGAAIPSDWSSLQSYFAITIILSLFSWTQLARVVRGKILSLREEDYATAARLCGASHTRIIFRHLVPGFTSHIIVVLTLSIPQMILAETALSFLGLGLRPPIVSWGVLLQECLNLQVVANYPWLLSPVVFIITTVLAFNFLGDGLRDAADPYSQ